ncbi:hypothetical protein [Pedobacter frigidisoli]|uniref:hypothetical protein n=1 Tax=Pedobacter frigidisoli TaxID=2530455 RepID=UPI001CED62C3|nr:hypothetical protein [Pedobacter frigidisoli]
MVYKLITRLCFMGMKPDKLNRRFRRQYSIEGGREITDDLQTGKKSFVFYLAGDAYSASAIWKEEPQSAQSSQHLYYFTATIPAANSPIPIRSIEYIRKLSGRYDAIVYRSKRTRAHPS